MDILPFTSLQMFQFHSKISLSVVSVCFMLILHRILSRKNHTLPPGPKGIPLLGNLLQLNHEAWYIFTEWKKTYGPIMYLNLAGQSVIVLNTHKAASDLLDRRASNYSDRPRFIVAGEILTRGILLGLTRYGDVWRRMRRACHEALNTGVAQNYHHVQTTEAILLAYGILTDSEHWYNHLRRAAASTVTAMVYDMPPLESALDPSITVINDMAARITRSAYPGTHLVEFFTFLEHTPKALAKWKREADEWFQRYSKMFEGYFNDIQTRVLTGEEQRTSFCATLVETKDRHCLTDRESAWLSATMYVAGSETTSSALSWFMLSVVAFPEVQRKAQAELDEVVGRSRLPSFSDFEHLPYIRALVKETLRWRPVDPLGLPHASVEDDWYEGYFIPKGSICLPNIWSMNRDPDVYGADANDFRPERHLDENGRVKQMSLTKDEGHVSYGFGRRLCVGRHVANNSLFIDISTILWAVNLEPAKDSNGSYIWPDIVGETNDGLVVRPLPFKCISTPRFANVEAILQQAKEEALASHPRRADLGL